MLFDLLQAVSLGDGRHKTNKLGKVTHTIQDDGNGDGVLGRFVKLS